MADRAAELRSQNIMTAPVSVLGLASAVPAHVLDQKEVAERARAIFAPTFARFPKLADVFVNSGIDRRYSVHPMSWFERDVDWSGRNKAYMAGAADLFVTAAESALARASRKASDIDMVVTVSSTGIATPSLEARVARRLGLRPDVVRVPVFGLGCAGGVSGLALASRLARAEPGKTVLLVVVELCTLAFRSDRGSKADVIACALFGDGAAAAVLTAGHSGPGLATIGAAAEHLWPGTLDIMGWTVDPIGFGVVLSRALPRFVEERFAAPARQFASAPEFGNGASRFVCHPGGAKVLAGIETALGLESGTLIDERTTLRDYGNMSAPTVLFVLERALARGLKGAAMLSALGPGFTASFLSLEIGHG
jgi:alkylresorcinol/alkylpyrone synthase